MDSRDRKKRILLTGGTGFVGQHVLSLLVQQNYDVFVITRSPQKAARLEKQMHVKAIVFDLVASTFSLDPGRFDAIIHLAWDDLSDYMTDTHFHETLPKHFSFLYHLIQAGTPHVLVSGTCFEYGLQDGPLSSARPTAPCTSYGFAKDALHKQLRFLQKKTPFYLQWMRLFYMYGPGQDPQSLFGQLDRAIQTGQDTFRMSNGMQIRDYLPVEDAVCQMCALFEKQQDGTYNICSGIPQSVRSIVEKRIRQKNAKIDLNLGYYDLPDHEPMAFWGIKP